jgi:hypothetical protein
VEFPNPRNFVRTEKFVIAQNPARQLGMTVLCFFRAKGKVQQSPK